MEWKEDLPVDGRNFTYRPTQTFHDLHQGRSRGARGRGRSRGGDRGAVSMESLNVSSGWRQNSGDRSRQRQGCDNQDGRRQKNSSDQDGQRQNWGDRGGPRQNWGDRGGPRQNWGDRGGQRQNWGDRGGPRQNWGDRGGPRQNCGDRGGPRQNWGDRGGQRQNWGDQGGQRQNSGDRGGQRQNRGGRDGWQQNFGMQGGFRHTMGSSDRPNHEGEGNHSHGNRWERKFPISMKELDKLTVLQPDLVVFELLSDKSGFPLLVKQEDIPPYKIDLVIKVLARATTSQSNRESVYELLNKTCGEAFVGKLMNYSLTLKRQFPEKGPVFFADLHAVLETFSSGMINLAVSRLINLVDSCHITLMALEANGHVEEYLVNKYGVLLGMLTESLGKLAQEEKMDKEARSKKRKAEMDNMEPPDNFRELSVLPTSMDIKDTSRPFLRRNVVQGRYSDGHHYLDVQFRLLREDFVRPLRMGICQFQSKTKSRIMDVRIYRNVTYVGCALQHRRIFHEVQLGSLKMKKLENSKRLMYGNFVCFSNDNFATMILGSVTDRNPEKLKNGIIGIQFESDISEYDMSGQFTMIESRAYFVAYKHVLQALQEMPENIPMEMYVVHVERLIDPPQYLGLAGEVYDLRVIKSNTMMKESEARSNFMQELLADEYEEDTERERMQHQHLQRVQITRALDNWPLEADLGLDSSQRRALRSALTRELAIIQGPPGTGKTFIGLKIVQILLHNSQVWKMEDNPTPILVVCFTNHALDQFLEGMMAFTSSIVRVGSRTQSERVNQFQINRLVQCVVSSRSIPRNIHEAKVDITSELKHLEEGISVCHQVCYECNAARGIFSLDVFDSKNIIPDHILHQLQQTPGPEKITCWLTHNSQLQDASRLSGQKLSESIVKQKEPSQQQTSQVQDSDMDEDEWKDAEEFIATEERDRMLDDDFEEPAVDKRLKSVKFEVTKEHLHSSMKELLTKADEEKDEAAYLQYLILAGQLEAINYGLNISADSQEVEALEAQPALNIWSLEPRMKWQLYNHWVAKLQIKVKPTWNYLSAELQRKVKALEGIKNAQYLCVMRKAAIVGMTTTGAAQYRSILQDLAPAIVVIEEAAEILESHVVTSLTGGCQHLIMIGDHQQLQPSATVYELATKYGLETSLFERLIKNGLAYETLEYQHRMRPAISRLLVPSIYPSLKDHPSVSDYPRVRGITDNIFFITHQKHERMESDDNNSHENQHEAELMIQLCRHLMLQGYSPDDITILTAYSGQFFLLRKLQRQNPICAGVRICVVDNFQGEENKIILLSLVRSNPEGKVGFLRTENRVCVALSRAKHGLYITGNMDLLSESSDLWKKIRTDLSESGSIGEALILRCENHPEQLSMVTTGQDFQAKSPEGGCLQVCAKPLPNCRHCCPQVCHLNDLEHKEYKCRVPCPEILCSLDHKCPKLCWQECGPCMVILQKLLPCSHVHKIPCHISPKSYSCPTNVMKVIPTCQHKVTMPCHQDPSKFTCPEDCDTRVECGHKCRRKCHRTKDPDHLEYSCMEQCTRINVDCTQNHECKKKCYQECGSCVVLVDKKLPCGHEVKDVECAKTAKEIQCIKVCKRILPCGHHCKKLCYKECGDCNVQVKKVVPACTHTIKIACSQPATTDKCVGLCPKRLPCGHPCQAQCKEKCTSKCPELVTTANKCPKGHTIQLPCHLSNKVQGEAAWGFCIVPCGKMLDCEHPCMGTCGRCLHGRLHVDCTTPCQRPLVCGHTCKYPCSASCPPCEEECQWKCNHSKCRQKCGKPCEPCKEVCAWVCHHKKCSKKCGEECSRKPCSEPCKKKLKCGHDCVGFCGDPCPPLCRVCNAEELAEFVLLGNEEEANARFVLLEDCGHCIEVAGLEAWLQQDDAAVGMKTCPRCRSAIYNNRRYQDLVLQAYKAVQAIKNKYYKCQSNIKTRDIELVLQDKEVVHRFQQECSKIVKKISRGGGRQGEQFRRLSIGEQTLCHFQAQILKKATSILNQSQRTESNPFLIRQGENLSKHLPALTPLVEDVVARVMQKTTTITLQMEREVTCELQRLMVLPAYWTFLEKLAVYRNESMIVIKAKLEALMDPTVRFDEELDAKVRALLKESEKYIGGLGISDSERVMILGAMGLRQGHWYKCPRGHIYCITECGGAMQESTCPECGSRIGGGSHRLRSDNAVASEMDGARHAAWSENNNMANFNLN